MTDPTTPATPAAAPVQPVQPIVVNVQHPGAAPLPPKSAGTAYLLVLFTLIGVAGIQHFYLGKVGRGILWLLTWGLLGIGTIVDLFTLAGQTRVVNARRAVGIK